MNNKKKTLILSILIVLITIATGISLSYAYWATINISDNSNIINSSCLNTEFKAISDDINLKRLAPNSNITEADISYAFTVKNNCENIVSYDVLLETLEGSNIEREHVLVGYYGINVGDYEINSIDDLNSYENSIGEERYENSFFNSEESTKKLSKYESLTPKLDNAIYSNKIHSGYIKGNTTHLFLVVLYPFDDEDNQEKIWNSKIIVNSNPINATNIIFNSGDEQIDQNDKIIEVGQEYGKLPTPHKDGYVFDYWYYGNDENNKVLESDIVKTNNNQILNAKWLEGTLLKTDAFFRFPYYKTFIHNIEFYTGDFTSLGLVTHNFTPSPRYNIIQTQWITDENAIELQEEGYTPVYAWYEDHTLYYYTDAPYIYFNEHDGFGARNGDINNTYRLEDSVDLSRFRTSKMTDMSYMFYGNINLTSLDLSNFDTKNVTNMKGMFERLENLQFLNISNFNTLNVTDMSEMFMNCKSLTLLDLSGFNVDRLQDASQMFRGSKKLLDINLSSFIGHTFEDKNMICLSGCDYGEYIYPEDLHGYEPSENAGCDTAFCTQ